MPLLLLLFLCGAAHGAAPPAEFSEHLIAAGLKGGYQVGYQVAIADLNKDGKPDIIALASGMSELIVLVSDLGVGAVSFHLANRLESRLSGNTLTFTNPC